MICSRCVKPVQLKRFIDSRGLLDYCQYCETVGNSIEADEQGHRC